MSSESSSKGFPNGLSKGFEDATGGAALLGAPKGLNSAPCGVGDSETGNPGGAAANGSTCTQACAGADADAPNAEREVPPDCAVVATAAAAAVVARATSVASGRRLPDRSGMPFLGLGASVSLSERRIASSTISVSVISMATSPAWRAAAGVTARRPCPGSCSSSTVAAASMLAAVGAAFWAADAGSSLHAPSRVVAIPPDPPPPLTDVDFEPRLIARTRFARTCRSLSPSS